MDRKRSLSAIFGLCCLGLMAWLLAAATGPASGKASPHKAAAVTGVTVTIGKPTELGYTLSKISALQAGTINFKVTNAGLGFHNFKVCTTPVTRAAANACVGKATKILKNGQSAMLTVVLTKSGKYEFLCSVPGHAAAGMKGLIGIGVKVTPSASSAVSTKGSGSGSSSNTAAPGPAPAAPGGAVSECPPGQTIMTAGGEDHDDDEEIATAPSDLDGCI